MRKPRADVKEIRMRPDTDNHDLQFKLSRARRILVAGNKLEITIVFRGREMAHPEIGRKLLRSAIEKLQAVGELEHSPRQEGRYLSASLAPINRPDESPSS